MMMSDFWAPQKAAFQLVTRVTRATGKVLHGAALLARYPAAGAPANPARAQFTFVILKRFGSTLHRSLVFMIETPRFQKRIGLDRLFGVVPVRYALIPTSSFMVGVER